GCRTDRGVCNGGQWYYEATVLPSATPAGDQLVPARRDERATAFRLYGPTAKSHTARVARGLRRSSSQRDVVGVFFRRLRPAALCCTQSMAKSWGLAYELPHDMRPWRCSTPAACLAPGAPPPTGTSATIRPGRCCTGRPASGGPSVWRRPINRPRIENPRAWRAESARHQRPRTDAGTRRCPLRRVSWLSAWQGVRANKGLRGRAGGRFYYEVEPQEAPALSQQPAGPPESGGLDIGRDARRLGYGADPDGFGLAGNQGKKMHSDEIDSYGETVWQRRHLDHGQCIRSQQRPDGPPPTSCPAKCSARRHSIHSEHAGHQTLFVNLGPDALQISSWATSGLQCVWLARIPYGEAERPEVMDRKSKGFTPTLILECFRESLTKRNSNLPSVDHKYDVIRENKQQIHAGQLHGGYNGGGGGTAPADYSDDNISKPMAMMEMAEAGAAGDGGGCEHQGYPKHRIIISRAIRKSEPLSLKANKSATQSKRWKPTADEHGNKVTNGLSSEKVRQVVTSKVVETPRIAADPPIAMMSMPSDEILSRWRCGN
uniref:SH2 domain-containing protein n=1 Tax=Macrostomum lignano TaxID=282301 RepID=A0A1I8FE87_9PLAT